MGWFSSNSDEKDDQGRGLSRASGTINEGGYEPGDETKPKICLFHRVFCIACIICMIASFVISYLLVGPSIVTAPYIWLKGQGIIGAMYLAIFHTFWILFGLPSSVLETLAGFMFGFAGGLATAFVGRQLGCTLAFGIGKKFGRECAEALTARWKVLRAIDYAVRTEPQKIIFGIMLANIPIQIKSYGFALFGVNFVLWFFALAITGLPYLCAYVYFGMASNDILEVIQGGVKFGDTELVLTISSGVITTIGLVVVFIYGRRAVKQL